MQFFFDIQLSFFDLPSRDEMQDSFLRPPSVAASLLLEFSVAKSFE
jgi:hypothetical protein